MSFDLLITNIKQLITCTGDVPKKMDDMNDIGLVENGFVLVDKGKIVEVGRCPTKFYADKVVNAFGKVVMPGFVDCHTHLVHAGSREEEFVEKVKGKSYLEILATGGGILSTVRATRKASKEELKKNAVRVLDKMLEHGTTTVEAKSGYGLNLTTELKCLELLKEINHPIEIIPTFLGAHAFPAEYKGVEDAYVDKVIRILEEVSKKAEFCDVFCEEKVFSKKQTEEIFSAAKKLGFKLKIHTDELTKFRGAELAAKLGCISADHLDMISGKGIKRLAEEGVIGVLLPGVPYHLMTEKYAPARKMLKKGMIIALATDYNPGSCPTPSMQTVIELAVRKMKMSIEEVINAVTVNAAYAVDRKDMGRIIAGYKADMIVLDISSYKHLAYDFGTNKVETVIKKGEVVVKNGKAAYTRG